jgi:hypothetical protein
MLNEAAHIHIFGREEEKGEGSRNHQLGPVGVLTGDSEGDLIFDW